MSRFAALVLAAGASSRFRASGGAEASKALAPLDGKPLVRHVVDAALASRAAPVIVVTGHARAEVEAALAGAGVRLVHNADHCSGLASSLAAGLRAVPAEADGAAVLLADMPFVSAALIDAVGAAFAKHSGTAAVVPRLRGEPGHPVLLPRALFAAAQRLDGDEGARRLLRTAPIGSVIEIEVADEGAVYDIDDLGGLRDAQARAKRALGGIR